MMDAGAIEIRIDVLAVEGLAPDEAPRFRAEVERELARLVEARGVDVDASVSRSRVVVTAETTDGTSRAAEVAAAVYRAVAP